MVQDPDLLIGRDETLYRGISGTSFQGIPVQPRNAEYGGDDVWQTRRDLEAFLGHLRS